MPPYSATRYPADFEESLNAASEEVAIIDVPASDLGGEADSDLNEVLGGLYFHFVRISNPSIQDVPTVSRFPKFLRSSTG